VFSNLKLTAGFSEDDVPVEASISHDEVKQEGGDSMELRIFSPHELSSLDKRTLVANIGFLEGNILFVCDWVFSLSFNQKEFKMPKLIWAY
jgi:hypothetical protein